MIRAERSCRLRIWRRHASARRRHVSSSGGSTAGNLAMILGICDPGDLVLVQRNVHKSIIHGLALAGARCVFLTPELDNRSSIAIAPRVETVIRAIDTYGGGQSPYSVQSQLLWDDR
ncbi:hypothetical protein [Cohnella ginsengisoli]|uniref:hypothetical protein n=1 Tax=Cohnella ginsengisoli TaxID=425004 RepID=UPI003B8A8A13